MPIAYGEAIAVAVLGLGVISSARGCCATTTTIIMVTRTGTHHHHDNNLRAAYLHVMADAATSVLAIAALVVAMLSQWVWADPVVEIVGSLVIASWAFGLIRAAGAVLLDVSADKNLETVIRDRIETKGDRVTDLHLWQVSRPSRRGDRGHLGPAFFTANGLHYPPLITAMRPLRQFDLRKIGGVVSSE